MTSHILKVGISAVFDPRVTPHGRTFLRALATARNHFAELRHVQFAFADDAADSDIARMVAQGFVTEKVDMVIGHFSSDAALAVLDIYADAGIPLLTPAATADAVTAGPGVYRLCPPDGILAVRLLQLAAAKGWRRLRLSADDSAHGQAIAAAVRSAAAEHGIAIAEDEHTCAEVFAGRFAPSATHVVQHVAACKDRPLILTDDAVSPQMPGQTGLRSPIYAVGFQPPESYFEASCVCRQHELLFGSQPETYFLESYAAFQVLAALTSAASAEQLGDWLDQRSFETVLGSLRFERGDACGLGHALWTLEEAGFVPLSAALAAPIPTPVAVLTQHTVSHPNSSAVERIPS